MEKAVARSVRQGKIYSVIFWTLAAVGLLLFAFVTIPPGARRSRALRADLDRARAIHAGLEYTRDAYEQCERALMTDPFFIEAVMRAKMRYRKPGEIEIVTGAASTSFVPVSVPDVPDFVPSPPPARTSRKRVAGWALLVASALLLAAAFLFFDRPMVDRYGRLIPPSPL